MTSGKDASSPASASVVAEALERQGVTHAVGLPDNASAALFELLQQSSRIRLVPVTREGEAFSVSSGLWLGGAHPVVILQNTGLLESGDALRGTAVRMGVPLVMLVTYRGFATLGRRDPVEGRDATRPDVDSAALVTEPVLRALGVPFAPYGSDEDIERIRAAFESAERRAAPEAVLIQRALS